MSLDSTIKIPYFDIIETFYKKIRLIKKKTNMKNALLLIDIQNDFLPGGALGVPEGDQILPWAQRLLELPFDRKIASQDWHPKNHASFAKLWPPHCIVGSKGADLAAPLLPEMFDRVIQKGTHSEIDSYSAFFDNQKEHQTDLCKDLLQEGINTLYIAGLATDYCVKFTVLDALQLGFTVFVIREACRGVNLDPHDSKNAFAEMERAGARVVSFADVEKLAKRRP